MSPTNPDPALRQAPDHVAARRRFRRVPWEKTVMWALILLAVYVLRDFFLIIFMTFIVSYIMRSMVVYIARLISPHRERIWMERILAVACFALVGFGCYRFGLFVGPKLTDQVKQLAQRVTRIDPQEELNRILYRTVGPFLLSSEYPDPSDERYQEAFRVFQSERDLRLVEGEDFGALKDQLESSFNADVEARARKLLSDRKDPAQTDFDAWRRAVKAPPVFEADKEAWIRKWRKQAERFLTVDEIDKFQNDPARRQEWLKKIYDLIIDEWDATNGKTSAQRAEWAKWKESELAKAIEALKSRPAFTDEFRAHYEDERARRPKTFEKFNHDFDTFQQLSKAYEVSPEDFSRLLREIEGNEPIDKAELLSKQRDNFEYAEQKRLTDEWLQKGFGAAALNAVREYTTEGVKKVTAGAGGALRYYLITLPLQLALSLLLSFLITLDIPKIRGGIRRLENSRIRNFYREIAPGVINFGQLIGRAFQAQGMIAVCNTLLTFTAIKLLNIQNEYFLSTIVFVCSFIPVLGVVLSSAPIAVMALIQPGGSLELAMYAIGAVLVIHFIETSLLNPKILGDMLHLHPVLVLAVLAVGEHFFRVWGLLLGVPVAVYIIRFVILREGIPGVIEPVKPGPDAEEPEESQESGESAELPPPRPDRVREKRRRSERSKPVAKEATEATESTRSKR